MAGFWPVVAAGMVFLAPRVRATWQDEIGYSQLVQELGSSLPKGAGVSVTLVEATLSAEGGEYLPTTQTAPSTGNFAGKSFTFQSGLSPVSFHAARVGSFFFGANTNPLAGDASVAPLAGSTPTAGVHCYQADRWLGSDFIRLGREDLPMVETGSVGNHSWIAGVGPDFSAAEANEALQRLDRVVADSNHLAVVGLNNGAGSSVPALLASAFNVISVGRTDGGHSTGTTPMEVDGPGRVKPELVAPMTATSWSTAVVSSCAAVLVETGGQISPQAQRSEVVRAVLLAGARKSPFPGWTNSATRPLDTHFGAGEVNLWRSYRILTAGEAAEGAAVPAERSGWHFSSALAGGSTRQYPVRIPEGCVGREVSVALVWNREIETTPASLWIAPTPHLANLDLRLATLPPAGSPSEVARSESGAGGSPEHPLEHVYTRDLPAGSYTLQVTNQAGGAPTDYGLAWFVSIEPAVAPDLGAERSADGASIDLSFGRLGHGLTYALQSSDDLSVWVTQQTFEAESATASMIVAAPVGRGFFRLVWVPPMVVAPSA